VCHHYLNKIFDLPPCLQSSCGFAVLWRPAHANIAYTFLNLPPSLHPNSEFVSSANFPPKHLLHLWLGTFMNDSCHSCSQCWYYFLVPASSDSAKLVVSGCLHFWRQATGSQTAEMCGRQSHEKFACTSHHNTAIPLVQCRDSGRIIFERKKENTTLNSKNLRHNGTSIVY